MSEPAADPKWRERLLQDRYQTKQDYFSWCNDMAASFMEWAKLYEEQGDEEAAMRAQHIAKTMKAETEKILQNG